MVSPYIITPTIVDMRMILQKEEEDKYLRFSTSTKDKDLLDTTVQDQTADQGASNKARAPGHKTRLLSKREGHFR